MDEPKTTPKSRYWVTPKEPLCLRLPVDLVQEVEALSYKLKVSRVQFIAEAIRAYLASQKTTTN